MVRVWCCPGEGVIIANLREPYAAAARQSLEWDEDYERAIDRIAAAGMCERFGLDLWRARYALDVASYQSARKLLVILFRERYRSEDPGVVEKVVEQCLHEFLSSACIACNGAREIIAGDLRRVCDTCGGTGVRRYSESTRSRMMEISFGKTKMLSHKFQWLLNEMATADVEVNELMNVELERLAKL